MDGTLEVFVYARLDQSGLKMAIVDLQMKPSVMNWHEGVFLAGQVKRTSFE